MSHIQEICTHSLREIVQIHLTKYCIHINIHKNTFTSTRARSLAGLTPFPSWGADDVSLAVMQVVQPGISSRTYEALAREQLLRWSILSQLRDDDLLTLDVSLAQRCLLRGLLTQLRLNPDLVQCMRQNKSQTPPGLDPTNVV